MDSKILYYFIGIYVTQKKKICWKESFFFVAENYDDAATETTNFIQDKIYVIKIVIYSRRLCEIFMFNWGKNIRFDLDFMISCADCYANDYSN